MSLTNYGENALLNHVTNTSSLTAATLYVKLHTGNPGEDALNYGATETTRQAISFSSASSGTITNSAAVEWTNVAANETYTHWSLWDASTSGNPIWYGSLVSSVAVVAGDTFRLTTLSLTLS